MLAPEDITKSWDRLNQFFFSQPALVIYLTATLGMMGYFILEGDRKKSELVQALISCQSEKTLIMQQESEKRIALLQSLLNK